MSYWERNRPIRRRRAVSPDRIAEESVRLLDEYGIEGLTLRGLAGALDVAPASLYSRIDGLSDALELALDHALDADDALCGAAEGGSARDLLLALYRHLLAHPWAVRAISLRPPRGPAYLAWSEALVVALDRDGSADPLVSAYAATNLVLGSALTASVAHAEQLARVDDGAAPAYARHHARSSVEPEVVLLAGLDAVLGGDGHTDDRRDHRRAR